MKHRAVVSSRLAHLAVFTACLVALLATTTTAQLVTLPVVNGGFEQPTTADDSRNFTTSIPGWTFTAVGGYVDDGVTNPGANVDSMLLPLPEGDQALIIQEATLEQTLAVNASVGSCTFKASVYVDDLPASTNSIRLYIGTHLVCELNPSADRQWLTLTHNFNIPAGSSLLGLPIRIEIDQWASPNKFTYWDDISIVCDPNPGCISLYADHVISSYQGPGANSSDRPDHALGNDPNDYFNSGDGGWIKLGFGDDFSSSGDSQPDICIDEVGYADCYTLKVNPADQFTESALQAAGLQQSGDFYRLGVTFCGDANVDLDAIIPGFSEGELQFEALKVFDDGNGGNGYELARVEVKFVCTPPAPDCVPLFASVVVDFNQGANPIAGDGPNGALGDDTSTKYSAGDGGDITLGFGNTFTTSGDTGADLCIDEYNVVDCYFVLLDPATAYTESALQAAGLAKNGDFYDLGMTYCGDENIDIDALVPGFNAEELRFDSVKIVDDGDGGNGHEVIRVEAKLVCSTPGPEFAKIGDRVWVDVDCDGIQDADEGGLPLVMVQLRDANGNILQTVQTDENGNYVFCVLPGTYFVKVFPAPDRFFLTMPGVGNDPELDSDFDVNTRLSGPITVDFNDVRLDIDAGACIICAGAVAFANNNLPACGLVNDPVMTSSVPAVGSIWTLSVDSDFPNSVIFVFFAPGPPIPFQVPGSTCFVYPDLSQLFLLALDLTDANGDWTISAPIPAEPILAGIELTFQSRVCDPSQQGPIPGIPDFPSNASHIGIGCP